MTAPPPPPAPSAPGAPAAGPGGGAINHSHPAPQPHPPIPPPPPPPPHLPPNASSAPPPAHMQQPHPMPFPPHPAYFYPPQSAAPPPPQPFVPHLTYMEGQFAAQALLVEQQRRIKALETELAQTQMEVIRLRAQVAMPHHHPAQIPHHMSPHDPHSLRHHPAVMQQPHVSQPLHPPQPQPLAHPPPHPHHHTHPPQLTHSHPDYTSHPLPVSSSHPRSSSASAPLPPSHPVSAPSASHRRPSPSLSSNHTASAPAPPEEQKKTSSRYWTAEEHARFLEGLQLFGQKDIKGISRHVGTRSATQVRTHAQKYYLRIERERQKAEQEGSTPASAPDLVPNGAGKAVNGAHAAGPRNSTSGAASGKGSTSEGKGKRSRSSNRDNAGPKHAAPTKNSEGGSKAKITVPRGDGKLEPTKADSKGGNGVIARKDSCGKPLERKSGANGTISKSTVRAKKESVVSGPIHDVVNGTIKPEQANTQNASHQPDENIPDQLEDTLGPSQDAVVNPEVIAHIAMPLSTGVAYQPPRLPSGAATDANQIPQRINQSDMETIPSSAQSYVDGMSHSKNARDDIASAGQNSKMQVLGGTSHGLPPPGPNLGANIQRRGTLDPSPLRPTEQVREESGVVSEHIKEFGKRGGPPLSKRSPKKRLKRPPTLEPLPGDVASSTAFATGTNALPIVSKASASSASGAQTKAEQKMYSLGEAGSMSNLRALLRVPGEDQAAGPSGSKPPTLKRNESSNSVLADLSRSVGVLSRSNSFISPSGKGVHRSNSILSLLSGLPTAMRESPSSDRLMMMEGEDRVMATLKSMDTGSSGAIAVQAGPSTPGPNPISTMGERSFSFSQLQHIGLDDLEDPNAVALALPDEQKWGDG